MTVQSDRLPANLSHIHKLLVDSFNQEELRTLCFDLGVRFDDLGGEGASAKARELLLRLERTKQIEALLAWVEKERAHVAWREGPAADAECPYKGLHAFREADAANFFGRDAFTEKLVGAVANQSLVAVVGPSGSGKSSVVYAGLVPVLRREGAWQILHFRPGSDPFLALAEGLLPFLDAEIDGVNRLAKARELRGYLGRSEKELRVPLADYLQQIREENPETQLFLIVDQFEELYTQVEANVRHDFLDVLLAPGFGMATHPFATLLLTMRADFMGQALAYPSMVAALQDNDVKIGLMADEELRLAIEQPAKNQGVHFAEGLVGRIVADVGEHAGNLPLLEFALTLLWERQSGGEMSHAAYEAIGGVRGALAQHADETLARLTKEDPERASIIQRVMVQLVQPGAGAEDTRRVARKADLGDVGWALAQRLAAEDARLLVTGREEGTPETGETVEVIHEALIQNWGQLKAWMEQDREFRMWQERLRSDMALWQRKQEYDYLLHGGPLTIAVEWLEKQKHALGQAEISFIESSQKRQQAQEATEEARRQQELKMAKELADYQRLQAKNAREFAETQKRLARRNQFLFILMTLISVALSVNPALNLWRRQQAANTLLVPLGPFFVARLGDQDLFELGYGQALPENTYEVPSFAIEGFEVTNERYLLCVRAGKCTSPFSVYFNNSIDRLNWPVVGVSAVQANEFCQWIGRRLPTELEWEVAARTVEGYRFPWGDTFPENKGQANFDYEESVSGDAPLEERLQAVGIASGRPNDLPLYDLAGNAWEWTSQIWTDEQYFNSTDIWGGSIATLPRQLVIKGGGVGFTAHEIETMAFRHGPSPFEVSSNSFIIGFRCAVDIDN